MPLPLIRGVFDRRILVNYRVDPQVVARLLPAPFRPQLIGESAMAGVCLIRLKQIRPTFVPAALGLASENAAYRFAVEWDEHGERRTGVFVPRRETSSWLTSFLGGSVFPGEQHHARFQIEEHEQRYQLTVDSDDGQTHMRIRGCQSADFPSRSVFGTLQRASDFFECGCVGYSATRAVGEFDGLELHSENWKVDPFHVDHVESSYFEDHNLFPAGSIEFDCALIMRNIHHQWCAKNRLSCGDQIAR